MNGLWFNWLGRLSTTRPKALLYADDLVIFSDTYKGCIDRLKEWKAGMEQKGLRVNMPKTKILISGVGLDVLKDSGWFPCAVCRKGEGANSILCTGCHLCVHKGCSGVCSRLIAVTGFICTRCHGEAMPIDCRSSLWPRWMTARWMLWVRSVTLVMCSARGAATHRQSSQEAGWHMG